MFPIRRAVSRFLCSPSIHSPIRGSRGISFLNSTSLRTQSLAAQSSLWQKRWVSDAPGTSEDAPVSKLQPTPQEEVEDAISADNAARTSQSSIEEPPAGASAQSSLRSSGNNTDNQASGDVGRRQPKRTIYIGNLFFDVTEDDLNKEVSRFGRVDRVKLIRDQRGLSKGFAYVSFSSVDEATAAINGLNQQLFEGRRLYSSYAETDSPPIPRSSSESKTLNPPSRTLYIGNMSWEMTDKDLNVLFKPIQGLIDVRVAVDRRTGHPRGFAHADFTDVKNAMAAFQELNGKEVQGRKLRLDYSYSSNSAPRNQARDQGDL